MNARMTYLLAGIAVVMSCDTLSPYISDSMWKTRFDVDGDGIPRPDDCDDRDPKVGIHVWYRDVDKDGFGAGEKIVQCKAPSDATATGTDCDDTKKEVNPKGIESCNKADDNCNGVTDENATSGLFADNDHDGFGKEPIVGCNLPSGATASSTDCNDGDKAISPDAEEICDNNIDENCNGETDDVATATQRFADVDHDGYGNPNVSKYFCKAGSGNPAYNEWVLDHTDCDDTKKDVNPGAAEACNDTLDNNCNGVTDTDAKVVAWYKDTDQDLYGDPSSTVQACSPPPGFVGNNKDCNDKNPLVKPGIAEVCNNGVDDNCDGSVNQCELKGTYSAASAQTKIYGNADKLYLDTFTFGDVNGDGKDDLIIGVKYDDTAGQDAGAVYLFLGPIPPGNFSLNDANVKWTGEKTGNLAGTSVSVGDINNDGKNDIIIGASNAIYLILGSTNPVGGNLSSASAKWTGEKTDDQVGVVSSTGDINGDGKEDILIGAPNQDGQGDNSGAVYLILGSTNPVGGNLSNASAKWTGETSGDRAGFNVSSGDTNGDGLMDIVVGVFDNSSNGKYSGSAYLLLGSTNPVGGNLSSASAKWIGKTAGDKAGFSVSMGDMNGDGKHEVLIGAPENDTNEKNTGAVYLIFGSANLKVGSLPKSEVSWIGEGQFNLFGQECSLKGDVNADNIKDAIIAAPYHNVTGTEVGIIYIFHGIGF